MNDFTIAPPLYDIHSIGDYTALSQTVGWGLKDLNIPDLWIDSKGENTTVVIIDTGYSTHSELVHCIDMSKYKSVVPGEYEDNNGHGTMVAGVVGAKDDMSGVVGVAPECKIIAVKCIPDSGMFSSNQPFLYDSLKYALELNPDVVNLSLGGYGRYDSKTEDLIQQFHKNNIPLVCAAGNNPNKPVSYPANYPNTIGVTSFKKGRSISSFSPKGDNIDFALPGEEIITTALNDQYAVVSGSSFASPFMCGIIALLISSYKKRNKTYTVDTIVDKLKSKCVKIDGKDKHEQFGWGIVNVKSLKEEMEN